MKLVVNPFLQAQLAYALHIAGPWSVAEPVQGVHNRFVLAQLGDRQAPLEGLGELSEDEAIVQDRKSTRLNSSHVRISYAVFCFEKKKNDSRYVRSAHSQVITCRAN